MTVDVVRDTKLGLQEDARHLGSKFFACIAFGTEGVPARDAVAVQARLMSRPMTQFMKRGAVVSSLVGEGLFGRHRDLVAAGLVEGLRALVRDLGT